MKLFIAVITASIAFPTAALAQSQAWYLIIGARHGHEGAALSGVPMTSEEQCMKAGDKIYKSREKPNNIHGVFKNLAYVCVQGY